MLRTTAFVTVVAIGALALRTALVEEPRDEREYAWRVRNALPWPSPLGSRPQVYAGNTLVFTPRNVGRDRALDGLGALVGRQFMRYSLTVSQPDDTLIVSDEPLVNVNAIVANTRAGLVVESRYARVGDSLFVEMIARPRGYYVAARVSPHTAPLDRYAPLHFLLNHVARGREPTDEPVSTAWTQHFVLAPWRGTPADSAAFGDSLSARFTVQRFAMWNCYLGPTPRARASHACWRAQNRVGLSAAPIPVWRPPRMEGDWQPWLAGLADEAQRRSLRVRVPRPPTNRDSALRAARAGLARYRRFEDSVRVAIQHSRDSVRPVRTSLGDHEGVVFAATPVNGTGDRALDSLGAALADRITTRAAAIDARFVSRAAVKAAERPSIGVPGAVASEYHRILRQFDVGVLVTSLFTRSADTLFFTQRALIERADALTDRDMSDFTRRPTQTWPLTRFRYIGWQGSARDTSALVDSLVAHRVVIDRALASCRIGERDGPPPRIYLCWDGPNVIRTLIDYPGDGISGRTLSSGLLSAIDDMYLAQWRREDAARARRSR